MEFREVGSDRLEGRWGFDAKTGLQLGAIVAGLVLLYVWVPLKNMNMVTAVGISAIVLALRREEISLNRAARTITIRWGIIIPFNRESWSLEGLREVSVCEKVRRLRPGSTYFVRFSGDSEPVQIAKVGRYEVARKVALEVARFLGWPLVDTCEGRNERFNPSEVGASLRQRMFLNGVAAAWPDPPARMISTCDVHKDSICVAIPAPGLGLGGAFGFMFGLALLLGGIWLFADPRAGKDVLLYLVFFCVTSGVILFGCIDSAISRTTIEASPARLRVTFQGVRTKVQDIPVDELQSLEIEPHDSRTGRWGKIEAALNKSMGLPYLVARSDDVVIQFAQTLNDEEMEWLRGAILYVVTGEA